jgi:hypothetical protein
MKNLITLILSVALSSAGFAAVWTVDNNLESGAQFTSVTTAMNAATAGDTLLIHPSEYSYGNLNLNKSLALIGPGHKPEVSGGMSAIFAAINLMNGSSGSIIEGFYLNQVVGSLWNVAHDITIRNNYFVGSAPISSTYGDSSDSDNWIIEGNVMVDNATCGGCKMISINTSAGQSDNWIFRNNVIQSSSASANKMFSRLNSTATFANNLIIYSSTSELFVDSDFTLFENNIFWCTAANLDIDLGCADCIFNNNLAYNPNDVLVDLPGMDNVLNEDPMFSDITGVNWNYDHDYSLSAGSPAIGAASDDGDVGIHGAGYNFSMEGYPADHPRLTFVTPQYIVVPLDTPFNLEFGAKRSGL